MASLQIDNCVADQIIEGLDRAIMTMRKGEEARVRICSDYFHGCKEKTTELSPLIYEVKLLDFTKVLDANFYLHWQSRYDVYPRFL